MKVVTLSLRRRLGSIALALGFVACNAIVGFGTLEKVDANATQKDRRDPDDPDNPSGDGDDDGEAPAADAGPRCDPVKPFDSPALAVEFDTAKKVARSAIRSPNELEAYFISGTQGSDFQLRRMDRPKRTAAWSTPATVALSAATQPLEGLSISAGGLKLYFYSCTSTNPIKCENFVSTREKVSDSFSVSRLIASDIQVQIDLFVMSTDDTVYYSATNVDAGGHPQIVKTALNSNGVIFSLQQVVPNISIPTSDDDRPILNSSETAMYFGSNRSGGASTGMEIWVSKRASKSALWGAPAFVGELSAPGTDSISWVSDDDCEIYVNRSDHVYIAKRPK